MLTITDSLTAGLPVDEGAFRGVAELPRTFPSKIAAIDIDPLMLGALALDLVQHVNDTDTILSEYGITQVEFTRLKNTTMFQREMKSAQEAVDVDGGLAAFRMRCRMAAEQILPHIANPLNLAGAKVSELVSAFKAVSEIGDIAPRRDIAPGSGATIIFQLPDFAGLPKSLTIDGASYRMPETEPALAAA